MRQEWVSSRRRARAAADMIENHVVWTVGTITLALAVIAAFSARETFRTHLDDLGRDDAVPVPKDEYDRVRAAELSKADH